MNAEAVAERRERFAEKNASRRDCRGLAGSLKRRQYNVARSLRRHNTIGGAFGRLRKVSFYDDLAAGTTAAGRFDDGGES